MKISRSNTRNADNAKSSIEDFNERYLDKQEVRQKLNVSSNTLHNWRKDKLISYTKIGNKIYYLKDSLDKLIADKTVQGNTDSGLGKISPNDSTTEKSLITAEENKASQETDTKEQKSFTSLWEPIPAYMVPVVVILIYLFAVFSIVKKDEPIIPFFIFQPLIVAIVGCIVFFLFQQVIKISRKYIVSKSSQQKEEKINRLLKINFWKYDQA